MNSYIHVRDASTHGKKWKEYGTLAEARLGYKIRRTAEYSELGLKEQQTEKVKYVVRCEGCRQIYERKRMCPLIRQPGRIQMRYGAVAL